MPECRLNEHTCVANEGYACRDRGESAALWGSHQNGLSASDYDAVAFSVTDVESNDDDEQKKSWRGDKGASRVFFAE